MSAHTVETPNLLEASFAPRQGELLSLPFDQYSRMRIAENVVRALHGEMAGRAEDGGAGFRLRVLDVGGYPGVLRHFLAGEAYDLAVLDVVSDDGTIPGYVQGSGLDLPFESRSFGVVTSLDTLEHIPDANRPRFIEEVQRVAGHAVLLINPVQSLEADLAEEMLDEYIRWILDAQQEQLAEHRQFGLPDFPATVAAFEEAGWRTLSFSTANIHNWLFMMVAKHYLISLRDERASAFERTLDRFYNLAFQESDHAQPAYRGVLVAVRPGLEGALRTIGDMYSPVEASPQSNTERLQLAQLLMGLIDLKVANHEDRKLREQMEHRDRHVAGLQEQIEHRDRHIAGLENKIELLEKQRRDLDRHVAGLDKQKHDLEDTLKALRESVEAEFAKHEAEFAKHKGYIARLEEEQRSKDEHILYLERLLQGIESGRVMRLTRSMARFLGRS